MNRLGLPGVRVEAQSASTCGIAGTHMAVTVNGQEESEPSARPAPGTATAAGRSPTTASSTATTTATGRSPSTDTGRNTPIPTTTPRRDTSGSCWTPSPCRRRGKAHARAVYDAIAQAEARPTAARWRRSTSTRWAPWTRWPTWPGCATPCTCSGRITSWSPPSMWAAHRPVRPRGHARPRPRHRQPAHRGCPSTADPSRGSCAPHRGRPAHPLCPVLRPHAGHGRPGRGGGHRDQGL